MERVSASESGELVAIGIGGVHKGENAHIHLTLTVLRSFAPARDAARPLPPPPPAPPPLPPAGGGGGAGGIKLPGGGGGGAGGHVPEDGGGPGGSGAAGGVGGAGGAHAESETCLSLSRRSFSCCSCL